LFTPTRERATPFAPVTLRRQGGAGVQNSRRFISLKNSLRSSSRSSSVARVASSVASYVRLGPLGTTDFAAFFFASARSCLSSIGRPPQVCSLYDEDNGRAKERRQEQRRHERRVGSSTGYSSATPHSVSSRAMARQPPYAGDSREPAGRS